MILNCKACEKRFVVPDDAITSMGRVVQCGSCGSKWKQFPIINRSKITTTKPQINNKKIFKASKPRKKNAKKNREISLYSPEYLAKKHGIKLNNLETNNNNISNSKISFGFYNSLIVFFFIIIILSRSLYFFQDLITEKMPITEFYLNYYFESIKNIFEIIKDLITSY
jgi:predicted Zn finger-like uncharacterized protein